MCVLFSVPVQASEIKAPEVEVKQIPDILHAIGFCESGNRQFHEDGTVVKGKVNNQDIGKYQINLKYHGAKAQELGFDLYTEQGNTDYALWLYEQEGSHPWNWSKPCWSKKI